MAQLDFVRAWKDEDYRLSLSAAERAALPDNPVGLLEVADSDLMWVAGGRGAEPNATAYILTMGCCHGFTSDATQCGLCSMTCPYTCWVTAITC